MSRIVTIVAAAAAALLLTACAAKESPKTSRPGKELANPEFTIVGVPQEDVQAGSSFTLAVSSKSKGAISSRVDKPAFATVKALSETRYQISVMSIEDTRVTVSFTQEEDDDYYESSQDISVNITGPGKSSLPGPEDIIEGDSVTYEESAKDIVNPERGMYRMFSIRTYQDTPKISNLKVLRQSGITLVMLEFYLTDYLHSLISSGYLSNAADWFNALRDIGLKAIVRFAYRDQVSKEEQEAPVGTVLDHVRQIKSLLRENEDVIYVLQAGFISAWGEWTPPTTYFEDINDRRQLCDALLDALPASRQIALRTPWFKKEMYKLSQNDTITAATAHNESAYSRLAGHNDCFEADYDEHNSYKDWEDRKFWMAETRYTIMGGESCAVSELCHCSQSLQDLADYHWSYMNAGYHDGVLNLWSREGCLETIKRILGYRLVLKDLHHGAIQAGQPCKVTLRLENKGFAAPMNPRNAFLVWKGADGKEVKSPLGADPRTWHSGYNAVVTIFTPSTDKGTLYLELSDPLLPDNPLYSIALANTDVFDAGTGYNKLLDI